MKKKNSPSESWEIIAPQSFFGGMPVPPSSVKVQPQVTPKKTVETEKVLIEESGSTEKEQENRVKAKVVGVQAYKRKSTSTISISELKNKREEEAAEEELEDLSNKPRTDFSLEELNSKWKSFAYQMKREKRQGLFVTLSKHTPALKENFLVEFEVDNEVQKMELETEKANLLSYLRNELNNFGIALSIQLTEKSDEGKKLNSKEKFMKMAENNEALHKLREQLNLDIEY